MAKTKGGNIKVSLQDLTAIKQAYEKAVQAGEEVFEVPLGSKKEKGKILVSFAKYLIAYLESVKK